MYSSPEVAVCMTETWYYLCNLSFLAFLCLLQMYGTVQTNGSIVK